MADSLFVGIDLACFARNPSAFSILDGSGRILELGCFHHDSEIIDKIRALQPRAVGIDAPLGFPLGNCCLDEECPCVPVSIKQGRVCEWELSQYGIGCFWTTKRTIIKPMVYRGVALQSILQSFGIEVFEIYPYASKIRLFGKPLPVKSSRMGRSFLRDHLRALLSGPALLRADLDHNAYDALIVAFTCILHSHGATEVLGDPREGMLVIPQACLYSVSAN